MRQIVAALSERRGTRFKPSVLASDLQLGRERTAALLRTLEADGKIESDTQGWFISHVNGEQLSVEADKPTVEKLPDIETWIVVAHAGKSVKVTVEFS